MKFLLPILLIAFSSSTYAIGSREITRGNIKEFGAKLGIEYVEFNDAISCELAGHPLDAISWTPTRQATLYV